MREMCAAHTCTAPAMLNSEFCGRSHPISPPTVTFFGPTPLEVSRALEIVALLEKLAAVEVVQDNIRDHACKFQVFMGHNPRYVQDNYAIWIEEGDEAERAREDFSLVEKAEKTHRKEVRKIKENLAMAETDRDKWKELAGLAQAAMDRLATVKLDA